MVSVPKYLFAAKDLYFRCMAPVCKAHGLTRMEMNILLFLRNNPGLDTAAQIVKYRNLSKSHVSVSVRSLQEKGLLTIFCSPGDRKSVHLCLTDGAQSIAQEGCQAQKQFAQILVRGFSQEEIVLLQSFMDRIQHNMEIGE